MNMERKIEAIFESLIIDDNQYEFIEEFINGQSIVQLTDYILNHIEEIKIDKLNHLAQSIAKKSF